MNAWEKWESGICDMLCGDYSESTIKFHKGGLESSEIPKIRHALKIITTMWANPSGGFIENGKDYTYIDFIYDKRDCLNALHTLREFIEQFAPIMDDNQR